MPLHLHTRIGDHCRAQLQAHDTCSSSALVHDVPVASLDCTWIDVLRVAKQSGVGMVSPVDVGLVAAGGGGGGGG